MPAIEARDGAITFAMTPAGIPSGLQLIIRCDVDGGVWLSIAPAGAPAQ